MSTAFIMLVLRNIKGYRLASVTKNCLAVLISSDSKSHFVNFTVV